MNTVRWGIGSALTASACCLGPAALAAVGLGGLGMGVVFARFSGLLVAAAAVLLALGWRQYMAEARRCKTAQCRMSGGHLALITLSVASVVVAGFALMHLGPLATRAACAISCLRPS
ncbi:MAG: hypothetical protein HY600_03885 [Candidatus Omnitrophica bacterium]|nr:hypothetical protein [Candidatus Omnitrophota bacterium]